MAAIVVGDVGRVLGVTTGLLQQLQSLPVEPLGPVELKGVSRELRLWRIAPLESTSLSLSVTAPDSVASVPET